MFFEIIKSFTFIEFRLVCKLMDSLGNTKMRKFSGCPHNHGRIPFIFVKISQNN